MLQQFLIEAVMLSVIGGLVGVGLGLGASSLISKVAGGWSVFVSPSAIALAFGTSAFVGILFGFYPARKAAQLSPIEALRYE